MRAEIRRYARVMGLSITGAYLLLAALALLGAVCIQAARASEAQAERLEIERHTVFAPE
jgi:hypothetical protein